MKSILMSIQAEHNTNIEAFKKLLELRKIIPKCELPIKVFTYESGKNGRHKVTNEWICDYILGHCEMANADIAEQRGCVKREFILDYSNGKEVFGMHISNLVIYDKPKELSEFKHWETWKQGKTTVSVVPLKRPPHSWCYVEEVAK